MKAAFLTLLAGLLVSFAGVTALAEDDKKGEKETVYKGELGCPKCVFKLDKSVTGGKCGNAIEVTGKGDKKTIYVLSDKGVAESYHKAICTGRKAGSVTATGAPTTKKDTGEQKYITPAKDGVKYD